MSLNWNVFLKSILLAFLGFLIGIVSTIIYLVVDVDFSQLNGKILNIAYFLNIFGLFLNIFGVFCVGFYVMMGDKIEGDFIECIFKFLKKWSSGDIFGELKQYSSIVGFIFISIGFFSQLLANLLFLLLKQ